LITVILVIHLILAIALVATVLVQRSEGGGLGMGGGTGLMTVRGSANLLTRITAFLAAGFMATSIVLAILSGTTGKPKSILDQPAGTSLPAETQPEKPGAPSVPLSQ
jgi:preprotein translocase subunit SecG